jgi:predicted nucleotidyltransferase
MAWWFGGCKARVIKVATDYILDLNNKIDNFFFPGDLLEKAEKIKGVDRQNRLKR